MYNEIIQRWKKANPLSCHQLGIHDYDGQVPDFSKAAMDARVAEIQSDLAYLQSLDDPTEKLAKYEYSLLMETLDQELFVKSEQQEFLHSPLPYIFPLFVVEGSYASRNFAPIETRVQSITQILLNAPRLFDQARARMKRPLARPKVQMGMNFLMGFLAYFKDELISFVSQVQDDAIVEAWSDANEKAVEAMEKFLQDLQTTYLPESHNDFALGTEKFMKMLAKTERVNINVEKLLAAGEAELERNYHALLTLLGTSNSEETKQKLESLREDHASPETILEETKAATDRTKQFLVDNDLVTIPSDQQCVVVDMPRAMKKFGFAAMNTPGPFEPPEASEAFYYVNVPEPTLPENAQNELLRFLNRASMEIITIHEAWPGHYLQLLYNNQTTSDIAKMFAYSGTMIEGWGLYTEEMIVDEGYEPFDRTKLRAAQLLGALTRDVRFVSAVKMHCYGMSVEESTKMFTDKAFMPPHTASIEANRGTVNPMYLYYSLGKLLIKKLREDYKKEQGDKYSLKKFHDEMLSYGSPPITVVRNMMLNNPGTTANIL